MLIIYNPEKNLLVLTILRLAMLINIGFFGVRRKREGVLGLWDYLHASKIKNDGGVFEIARREKKILPKHGQLIKTKKSEKEKNGLYIYIFNILFFFFFFLAVFSPPPPVLLNAAAACKPLFFLGFFIYSQ